MQSELRLSLLQRRQHKVQAASAAGNNSASSSSSALDVPPVAWLPDGGNGNPSAAQQLNFFGHGAGTGSKVQTHAHAQTQNQAQIQAQIQNQSQTQIQAQAHASQRDKRVDFLKLPQEIQLPFNIGRNANVNTNTVNHAVNNQEAAAAAGGAYNQDQYNYSYLQNLPKKSPRNLTYQEEENESRRKLFALVSPKGRGMGNNGLVMESPRRAEGGAFTPRGNNAANTHEIPPFVTPQQRQNAAAQQQNVVAQRQAAQQQQQMQYQVHPTQVQQVAAGLMGHDHQSGGSTSGTGTGTTNLTNVDSKDIRREKNKESARKYRQRKREVDDEKANRLRILEQENRLLMIELRATYDHAVSLMNAARAARVIPEDEVVPYNAHVMNPNPS